LCVLLALGKPNPFDAEDGFRWRWCGHGISETAHRYQDGVSKKTYDYRGYCDLSSAVSGT
jgi:hypothetical protein